MFRLLGKRAQTTAEYAVLIALVVGAVVAMQVYVRRGMQGRIRDVVDHTGTGGDLAGSKLEFSADQYEPYYLESSADTVQKSTSDDDLLEGDAVARNSDTDTTVDRTQTMGWKGYK